MQDELKPCPFCGGAAALRSVKLPMLADCDDICIYCTDCDVDGPHILFDQTEQAADDIPGMEAEAITAWNTRVDAHPPTTNPVDDRETPVGDHQMVTQEDRELVYALMLPAATTGLEVLALETIRSGKGDDAEAVQMVTRHRQAALTAARAQDRNEIEAWQVAAETWQQNFQDASCENQRLRETLERIEKFKAWGSPKYALAELRQFARQALAAGEHRKDAP